MQGKTLYTILLSIIAVLTLALAVLVIFLFTTFNSGKVDPEKNPTTGRVVPLEEQLQVNLYAVGSDDKTGKAGEEVFVLKESKEHPNSFLMTSITLVYDGGTEKEKVAEARKALFEKTYLGELKEATIEYFASKTYEDIKADNAMQLARDSLLKIYSNIISENPDEKIILKVVFEKWIPQSQ